MTKDFINAYFFGEACFSQYDYINARKWFEIAYNDPEFKDKSLLRLLQIDLKEGNYAKVRKLLDENIDSQTVHIKQIYGLLENIETNYESSKRYYSECMIEPEMQNKALLLLAKVYIQTGDNEIARKMLETLQLNRSFELQSTFGLVCLNILEKNYKDAEKLLKYTDKSKISPKLYQHYRMSKIYIKYLLNQLNSSANYFNPNQNYAIYRLFDNSDELLLKHIQKHKNQKDRETKGCFFIDTDLKKLLSEARDKIETMNSNHFELSDMYRFRLDKPIGFKDNGITSDLCVVTIIGTKKILTMYPVSLSDKFDQEGLSTSKELMLKRNGEGAKR